MTKLRTLALGCALSITGCVGVVGHEPEQADREIHRAELSGADAARTESSYRRPPRAPLSIDARRSLAITDQPILAHFSFQRVMSQLVSQARVPGLTATALFQQWWDTQNPSSGVSDGERCDDVVDPAFGPTLNGYPYTCRPAPEQEGAQASCDPFTDPACAYIPIGLFSRFELAPENGAHCGEYRIVFAKTTGQTNNRDRNLLIFEAALPNPSPRAGLAGCRPIAKFWADLSRVDDIEERAARLSRFYFDGMTHEIGPVVDIRNYGDNAGSFGQVRTNQFVQPAGLVGATWSLREFKLEKRCQKNRRGQRCDEDCTLAFTRTTAKSNPFGPLFTETSQHRNAGRFQRDFIGQVANLAGDNAATLNMTVRDKYNSGQSEASGSTETNYIANFEDGGEFAADIQDRLDDLGSQLEPLDIIARAQTQSCAGCHRLSNNADLGGGLVWPASLGFTHVAEANPEVIDGVTRFRISDALTTLLLPQRKAILEAFLTGKVAPRGYGNIGGRTTH